MSPRLLATAQQAFSFLGMTYPNFRERLARLGEDPSLVAVAAWKGVPAGLALAEIKRDASQAEILSLFVSSNLRGQGCATLLLATLEQELLGRGVSRLSLTYPSGKPTTVALESLLRKRGWDNPRPHMVLFRFTNWDRAQLFSPAWMRKSTLPPDYAIFSWKELSTEDRHSLQGASAWYPTLLSPFNEEQNLEPATSVGLRYRGQVAGWLITHRIARDTIRYTSLFVRPELPLKGCGLRLLAETMRRHFPTMPSNSFGCFGSNADNPLLKLVERRVLSLFGDVVCTRTMISGKDLTRTKDSLPALHFPAYI